MNLGRYYKHKNNHQHIDHIVKLIPKIKQYGIKIKINTVVTKFNYFENLRNIISTIKPDRWKVFEVLPILSENDQYINDLMITSEEFNEFCDKHSDLNPVFESNLAMKGSYIMFDPIGRFFDNVKGFLQYSGPILEVGLLEAFSNINFHVEKFHSRNGYYNWSKEQFALSNVKTTKEVKMNA